MQWGVNARVGRELHLLLAAVKLWRHAVFPARAPASSNMSYTASDANVHPRDAGVVVGDLLVVRNPRGQMDMLVLGLACQARRDEHVVELLCVHVEQVCVALQLIDASNGIHVLQARELDVLLQRLDEGELVEVAGGDDVGVLVLAENVLSEVLVGCIVFRHRSRQGHGPFVRSVASRRTAAQTECIKHAAASPQS